MQICKHCDGGANAFRSIPVGTDVASVQHKCNAWWMMVFPLLTCCRWENSFNTSSALWRLCHQELRAQGNVPKNHSKGNGFHLPHGEQLIENFSNLFHSLPPAYFSQSRVSVSRIACVFGINSYVARNDWQNRNEYITHRRARNFPTGCTSQSRGVPCRSQCMSGSIEPLQGIKKPAKGEKNTPCASSVNNDQFN